MNFLIVYEKFCIKTLLTDFLVNAKKYLDLAFSMHVTSSSLCIIMRLEYFSALKEQSVNKCLDHMCNVTVKLKSDIVYFFMFEGHGTKLVHFNLLGGNPSDVLLRFIVFNFSSLSGTELTFLVSLYP